MRVGGPDLLAVDDEIVAVLDRAGLQRSDVGTGVGLGVALAPDLVGRENLRHVALFLLLGAPLDERWPDQHRAELVDQRGRVCAAHLLAIDELLGERGAAAAVLFGPADADPSAAVHLFVPRDAALPVARALVGKGPLGVFPTFAAGQIGVEPAPQLRTKSLVLCAELEIHGSSLSDTEKSSHRFNRRRKMPSAAYLFDRRGSYARIGPMRIATGKVVAGKVVVDGSPFEEG